MSVVVRRVELGCGQRVGGVEVREVAYADVVLAMIANPSVPGCY